MFTVEMSVLCCDFRGPGVQNHRKHKSCYYKHLGSFVRGEIDWFALREKSPRGRRNVIPVWFPPQTQHTVTSADICELSVASFWHMGLKVKSDLKQHIPSVPLCCHSTSLTYTYRWSLTLWEIHILLRCQEKQETIDNILERVLAGS